MSISVTKFSRSIKKTYRKTLWLIRKNMAMTVASIDALLSAVINYRFQSFKPYITNCDECLVLGNGPSLKEVIKDLPVLRKGRDLFCINWFAITDYYTKIKPSHYVFLDPAFWFYEVSDELSKKRDELFNKIEKATNWPLLLFLPHIAKTDRGWKRLSNFNNSNITICYYYHNGIGSNVYTSIRHFLYKYNAGTPSVYNVLIPTIFLATNLGYKKIFLFGADHSWFEQIFVGSDNVLYKKDEHFYNKQENKIPIYKAVPRCNEVFKVYEICDIWSDIFEGYIILEEYARQKGVKIYNASSKSYIDAFERIKVRNIKLID